MQKSERANKQIAAATIPPANIEEIRSAISSPAEALRIFVAQTRQ
jgi:hypothetical protein